MPLITGDSLDSANHADVACEEWTAFEDAPVVAGDDDLKNDDSRSASTESKEVNAVATATGCEEDSDQKQVANSSEQSSI
jgi:hypothetical protein